MRTKYAIAMALILTSSAFTSVYADDESRSSKDKSVRYKIMTGVDYSTGKYGQSETTKILYAPIIAKATYQNWTGKITIPWLRITGPGTVIGGGDTSIVRTGTSVVGTEEGLGDVIAALSYNYDLPMIQTSIDFTGKIKLPTADESKGLGTGLTDTTFGIEATKMFGKANMSLGVSRKFVGSDNTFDLHNIWVAHLRAGYAITPNIDIGSSYDWHQSSSNGPQPRDVMAYINYKLPNQTFIQAYAMHGLSDGSADNGGGIMIGYKF